MIVFVGDKPSAKNVDPNIPFVGTQSYKRLLEWIWEMDIDINETRIMNKDSVDVSDGKAFGPLIRLYNNTHISTKFVKFVALGNKASKILEINGLSYFKLPHPSGLNRKLNDKKYVSKVLKECKEWLRC